MTVRITQGGICVDFAANEGHLTVTYQITGGTGRFKGASGDLTLNSTLTAALSNSSGAAVLLTNTGEFEGAAFGAAIDAERQGERQ